MRALIERLWYWLLRRLGLLQPPSDVPKLEFDDVNAIFTWPVPTKNDRQAPIQHVRIDARVVTPENDGEWAPLTPGVPPNEPQTLTWADPAPGDWEARAVVVDIFGEESRNPPRAQFRVAFDPPSDLASLNVELLA